MCQALFKSLFLQMTKLSPRRINNLPKVIELANKYNGLVTFLQCLFKMKIIFTKDTDFAIYNFDVIGYQSADMLIYKSVYKM